jgi:tRNA-2-methylthio-N6-dimethylallyladenosine synthase
MNRAESERLGGLFEVQGYLPTTTIEEADLILLNSCVVRQSAENRIASKIGSLRALKEVHPGLTLAVTGCLVDSDIESLRKRFSHVDHFFKAGHQPQWLKREKPALPLKPPVSCFVPVIQGCNNYCAYCIVPYRRGGEVSRPLNEVACEVRELVRRGVKEVVLLGQNVDAYGHDLPKKPDLADLLAEINGVRGLKRIRFLTNHPKDMTGRLITAIASLEKVCHQLNLPIQSGDDAMLRAMRRGYDSGQFRLLVTTLRNRVPDITLSTDVIVGFPGESQSQFENTYKLLEELRFDTVHVAVYSPRPGTMAAREYKDDVLTVEKKRRLDFIEHLQEDIARENNVALKGQTIEVLVEDRHKGKWRGRSRSGKLVFFTSDQGLGGRLENIRIEKTGPWSLQGRLIDSRK